MPECMIFSGPGRVLPRSFFSAHHFFGTYPVLPDMYPRGNNALNKGKKRGTLTRPELSG